MPDTSPCIAALCDTLDRVGAELHQQHEQIMAELRAMQKQQDESREARAHDRRKSDGE